MISYFLKIIFVDDIHLSRDTLSLYDLLRRERQAHQIKAEHTGWGVPSASYEGTNMVNERNTQDPRRA